jgi:hypothetical protein
MCQICFPSFVVDQSIIKEDKHKVVQKGLKELVYEALKRGGSIAKTRRHYQKLIMSFKHREGSNF